MFNVLEILFQFIQILKTSCNIRKLYFLIIFFLYSIIFLFLNYYIIPVLKYLTSVVSHDIDKDVFSPKTRVGIIRHFLHLSQQP